MDDVDLELCATCGSRPSIGIFSSGMGPVSEPLCDQCRSNGAENLRVVLIWLTFDGSIELLTEMYPEIVTFHNGEYVGLDVVKEIYEQQRLEVKGPC